MGKCYYFRSYVEQSLIEAFDEIEPGTFVSKPGPERGLPHHIFDEDEIQDEFSDFLVQEVSLRAEGKVLAIWAMKP